MLKIHEPDPGPERIGEILSRLFTARGWGRRSARLQLEKAWSDAVGAKHQSHTRVLQVRKGVLEVEVDSAIVMQELSSFHKRRLLDKLKRALPNTELKELRFRSGAWKK
jgi:predicted nucleic acid-binding Zn ribbon protein